MSNPPNTNPAKPATGDKHPQQQQGEADKSGKQHGGADTQKPDPSKPAADQKR